MTEQILMVGLDYTTAPVSEREQLAMTKEQAKRACRTLKQQLGVGGCVLLSTCNRTELWVSGSFLQEPRLWEALCQIKGLAPAFCGNRFRLRKDREAVFHLFQLASGMKSQVFGEDQIIAQVGEAAELSRQAGTMDAVLETLFRMAITAAKSVKTHTRLAPVATSVAARAVRFLEEQMGSLEQMPCLVIGNGEIGRLAAAELLNRGAEVAMTIRSHHGGGVEVPAGCTSVPYDNRLLLLPGVKLVISATSSPHYTLRAEELPKLEQPVCFCDLAVPRDIDPKIALIPGASLFHTDDVCADGMWQGGHHEQEKAERILSEGMEEFFRWQQFYPLISAAKEAGELAAQDFLGRVEKNVKNLDLPQEEKDALTLRLETAVKKTVERLAFGLREQLEPQLWEPCLRGLMQSARQGTHHE